jgi:protein-glucosylgalactosylhydroxylysine glucosidase
MSEPISPPPLTEYKAEYIPAYLSNGLLGLRVGRIPLIQGLCIVNGLAAIHPADQVEGFARAPHPVAGDIALNGNKLSEHPERGRFIEQRYDFSCGELRSRFAFDADGIRADAEHLVFCSRTQPTLVLQELRVTVNSDCDLSITMLIDQTDVPGRYKKRETDTPGADKPAVDGSLLWECHGSLSTCGAAYVTRFEGGEDVKKEREEHDETAPLRTSYSLRARAGSTHVVRTFSSLIPSQTHSEPHRQALRLAAIGSNLGFDRLREENRVAWNDLWRGRVQLIGAGRRWQSYADAAYYYLHSSAHGSSLFSTSMFGLAYWPNYHYYRGQVMWDIETFVFPPTLLTDPRAADSLLYYRSERTHAARRNAALNGYRGLQFPWASGPLHGEEMIRVSAPLIALEQHVGLSVALAFAQYAHVTGDEDFLNERAWPILEGVAQWISSRVERTGRGYEIKRIIGIAEQREEPIDNAGYINMAAKRVLYEAAAAARRLGRKDADWWEGVAERLFVPWANGVLLNHDRFTPEEGGVTGATPEALAALFPIGYCAGPDTERSTIEFYLDRVDEFIGYPMLSALLGVYAAWIGDRKRSLDLFERGYADFILEPFSETAEFSRKKFPEKPRVGPFQANLGGFLTSCLLGLPGIQIGPEEPSSWARRPVKLPAGWDAIEVERLWIRNRPASLRAAHGAERAEIEFTQD